MEKLQAALEVARGKRAAQAGGMAPGPRAVHRSAGDARTDALWEALAPFQPSTETLEKHRVITGSASAAGTPFDILRTKILLQMKQNGWTRLAVTSPLPRSGKTTTACNLVLGFGRQQDLRSMLFDLDLRNPSVHRFFDHPPAAPIGALLREEAVYADQALRIGANVAVSMSAEPEADPTRLMLSDRTSQILDAIQEAYRPDVMIFDLPSALASDDTRAFLKNVDCAIIVARANATRYAQFDACEREVGEHTNVLGVVLNACRHVATLTDFE